MMKAYCHNGLTLVDDTVSVNINNERKIQLEQAAHDDCIHVTVWSAERNGIREVEEEYTISPGDMVMLLNWYKCQKENGNKDLSF